MNGSDFAVVAFSFECDATPSSGCAGGFVAWFFVASRVPLASVPLVSRRPNFSSAPAGDRYVSIAVIRAAASPPSGGSLASYSPPFHRPSAMIANRSHSPIPVAQS